MSGPRLEQRIQRPSRSTSPTVPASCYDPVAIEADTGSGGLESNSSRMASISSYLQLCASVEQVVLVAVPFLQSGSAKDYKHTVVPSIIK